MSGCDRMTTPLGTRTKLCFFCLFIAKNVLRCFCCCVVCIYQVLLFIYYLLFIIYYFTILACTIIHVYHAYILDTKMRHSHITQAHFVFMCGINFKISGGVTAPQWF
jgi:hypothetical protein